jgi:glycosyltransferase involved in cell wall biosynthesis
VSSKSISICYLSRSLKNNAYSIEELFMGIRAYLQENGAERLGANYIYLNVPEQSNSLYNIIQNIRFARTLKHDIIHITGDIHYILPFLRQDVKKVITIHDLGGLSSRNNKNLKYWILNFFWYILPSKYADSITVISEKTKQDLLDLCNIENSKVTLIPNYVKSIFTQTVKRTYLPVPTFLLVGGGRNKNIERSINALKSYKEARLIMIGDFTNNVFDTLRDSKIIFKHYINISHQQVASLYAESDIVLFPSLYEGFGMPIIEGQATGRPVITSDRSPMKEIAGPDACLVNPESIPSIKAAIDKILTDGEYTNHLIQTGLANAQKYDITNVANAYQDIYVKLMSPN